MLQNANCQTPIYTPMVILWSDSEIKSEAASSISSKGSEENFEARNSNYHKHLSENF